MSHNLYSKSVNLNSSIEYSNGSIVSKTIIEKPSGTITLFAFDKGQSLSKHSTPFDALIQVIDGKAEITIDEKEYILTKEEVILMPANIPHAVRAIDKFKMILTMIKE